MNIFGVGVIVGSLLMIVPVTIDILTGKAKNTP